MLKSDSISDPQLREIYNQLRCNSYIDPFYLTYCRNKNILQLEDLEVDLFFNKNKLRIMMYIADVTYFLDTYLGVGDTDKNMVDLSCFLTILLDYNIGIHNYFGLNEIFLVKDIEPKDQNLKKIIAVLKEMKPVKNRIMEACEERRRMYHD